MKRPIPLTTLLRFPLLFGGFLSIGCIGFFYRDKWLGDIEVERNKLFKENIETNKLIQDVKRDIWNRK